MFECVCEKERHETATGAGQGWYMVQATIMSQNVRFVRNRVGCVCVCGDAAEMSLVAHCNTHTHIKIPLHMCARWSCVQQHFNIVVRILTVLKYMGRNMGINQGVDEAQRGFLHPTY